MSCLPGCLGLAPLRRLLLGSPQEKTGILGVQDTLESRVGKVPLRGRYHGPSRSIESDYVLSDQVLGTGYSGAICLAKRRGQPRQKYAVKALTLKGLARPQLERLKNEVENFLCMDHPHITRLHDVYESGTQLFLVMECLEGGELFDRVVEKGRFCEKEAAEAMWQMLLAVNYLHSHGVVHRDIKLENFLFDRRGGSHLKLIDFGFSKVMDPSVKITESVGTVAYMAPEVLSDAYGSQCDLWSLGVINFILLAGYMPFLGPNMMAEIQAGAYNWQPAKWADVPLEAQLFVKGLLELDPNVRMTAEGALEHPWLKKRSQEVEAVDSGVVEALRSFRSLPAFRRCCQEMIAWGLSNEESSQVRKHFIAMDANRHGTITLEELRRAMEVEGVMGEEVLQVFYVLDANHDNEIQYSDFLAAMVSTKIDLRDELLRSTFQKFDADGSGDISAQDLRSVLGDTYEGECVEALLREVDAKSGNGITYPQFVAFLRAPLARPPPPSPGKASKATGVAALHLLCAEALRRSKRLPRCLALPKALLAPQRWR